MDKAIEWFEQRRGKVSYSMINRNGPSSYDCSSSIYHSLIYAGILPAGHRIGNTETMFVDLPKYGFQRIEADSNGYIPTQRGDIFIWGKQGFTSGANGHTGIHISPDNIIHCAYGYNGIHIDNHDWLAGINNVQYLTVFRYTGKPQNTPASAPKAEVIDDIINVGSHLKFSKAMQVAETTTHEGRKELRIEALCPRGFTWAENGVPADWVVKVDADGYKVNGEINAGDWIKIEGAFVAEQVVQNDNMWFALIRRGGIGVWVELTPTTEIPAGEFGTKTEERPKPVEEPKPTNNQQLTVAEEEPKAAEVVASVAEVSQGENLAENGENSSEKTGLTVQKEEKKDMSHNLENAEVSNGAEDLGEVSRVSEEIQPIEINARKFTNKEVKMLEKMQKEAFESVANTEYEPTISEKTKTTVYFVADLGILLNMLVATVCVILLPNATKEILAISGAVATALAGLKPIFKLGARK